MLPQLAPQGVWQNSAAVHASLYGIQGAPRRLITVYPMWFAVTAVTVRRLQQLEDKASAAESQWAEPRPVKALGRSKVLAPWRNLSSFHYLHSSFESKPAQVRQVVEGLDLSAKVLRWKRRAKRTAVSTITRAWETAAGH